MSFEGYKVVTAKEMARTETLSIQKGASALEYMLKAGQGIAERIATFIQERNLEKQVILLVGKGNNGGDAFTAGAFLKRKGHKVIAYSLFPCDAMSPLCQKQKEVFEKEGGTLFFPKRASEIVCKGVVIDGLLGTGFQGALTPFLSSVIAHVNQSQNRIISIDIPSGVDGNTGNVDQVAIQAVETLFLGLPKVGFFIGDGYNHTGKLSFVDFGMKADDLQKVQSQFYMLGEKEMPSCLPPIVRTRHKYSAGYVVAVAGSCGMSGAAALSCLAALRAGCGIIRLFHPMGMESELSNIPHEIVKTGYENENAPLLAEMVRAKAMLLGPGLGKERKRGTFLQSLIKKIKVPTVIDADALFHLKGMFANLPFPAILTPHHKEMLNLLGKERFDHMIDECQEFTDKNNLTLILKGAPTFIFEKGRKPLVVSRGDPGMATAGTGDVLTGIIAGLLSQNLQVRVASAFGVYLHARAGEHGAKTKSSYSLIASDLIAALPEVFKELIQEKTTCFVKKRSAFPLSR